MPYISQQAKLNLFTKAPDEPGELAYDLTVSVLNWLGVVGESYATYATAIGVLDTVKTELYRRLIAPYEDKAIAKNGDVYHAGF